MHPFDDPKETIPIAVQVPSAFLKFIGPPLSPCNDDAIMKIIGWFYLMGKDVYRCVRTLHVLPFLEPRLQMWALVIIEPNVFWHSDLLITVVLALRKTGLRVPALFIQR